LKKSGNSIASTAIARCGSAGPNPLKTLHKSAQNRTKHRNLAQATLPAKAHSYGLATHIDASDLDCAFASPHNPDPNHEDGILARSLAARDRDVGHSPGEVAAPSWSAACMIDHGPSECDEPMWVHGSPRALSRSKSAF
jgi:hypothetical protein